jgi:hypothetical protein
MEQQFAGTTTRYHSPFSRREPHTESGATGCRSREVSSRDGCRELLRGTPSCTLPCDTIARVSEPLQFIEHKVTLLRRIHPVQCSVIVAFFLGGCSNETSPPIGQRDGGDGDTACCTSNDVGADRVVATDTPQADVAVTDVVLADVPMATPICVGSHCHYVRSGATGRGDGSDWTHAFTALPTSLQRGDVYYIAAGTYPDHTFNDAAMGSAVITVRRATSADHGPASGWNATFATGPAVFSDLVFSASDYDLDGQTGGGPGAWETNFGFTVRGGGHNIEFAGTVGRITLRHLDVENLGRYHSNNGNDVSVYAIGGAHDLTFSRCFFHDVNGVQFLTRDSRNVMVEYSKLARNGPVEDRCADGPCHREAWSASTDDNITIRYSVFEDISNTAFIFLGNGDGAANRWTVYGNVFWYTGRFRDVGVAGLIYVDSRGVTVSDWRFHHNVIANVTGLSAALNADGTPPGQLTATNNIWIHNVVNQVGVVGGTQDYNTYIRNTRTDGCTTPCQLDEPTAARETHGVASTVDPFVARMSGDFHLRVATAPGNTLTAPLDRDPEGTLRGIDSVWDRGVYEYR